MKKDSSVLSFNPCFGGNQKSNKVVVKATLLLDAGFNPCFGGNQKSNQTPEYQNDSDNNVSILVLVEIRNQINAKYPLSPRATSFNPCFGGNQKSNCSNSRSPQKRSMFQSLFWWKSEIKSLFSNFIFPSFCSFQSLFWWKSEIKSRESYQVMQGRKVSILVLVEIRNQIRSKT